MSAVRGLTPDPPVFLRQPATPCLTRLAHRSTWTNVLALDAGGVHVGVRPSTLCGAEAVTTRFAAAREPELDDLAPPNFSLEVGGKGQDLGPRGLHVLYRDHVPVARGRTLAEVIDALAEQLTAVRRATSRSRLAVRSSVLVTQTGGVVLLPAEWHWELLTHQRRLAHRGLRLLSPDVHLVERDGHLVLPARFPDTWEQRAPVSLWTVKVAGAHDGPLRPARGVQLAFGQVMNRELLGARKVLLSLADVTTRVPFRGIAFSPQDSAVERATTIIDPV